MSNISNKPDHFRLLHRLFITGGKPNKNWTRLTLGVRSKDKWINIKMYILSSVKSRQYKEFLYLLQHDWVAPVCRHCGGELKFDYGYKEYCSHKCARAHQHTGAEASATRRKNRALSDETVTIDKNNLAAYDSIYIPLLVEDGRLSKHFTAAKTANNAEHSCIRYADIRYWLSNRIPWSNSWSETIYCIYNGIIECPHCKICGKHVTYISFKKGYRKYCSQKCCAGDKDIQNRISAANIKNASTRGEKISAAKQSKTQSEIEQAVKKSKNTRFERYGNENYNNIKQQQLTNLKRYGHVCALHAPLIKEKYHIKFSPEVRKLLSEQSKARWKDISFRKSNIEKMKHAQKKLSEEKKQLKINCYNKWWVSLTEYYRQEWLYKVYKTKKLHNTLNTSQPEEELAAYILQKFPDMKRQYRSQEYPFACDFYIPCIDTYIELQGTWTHGGHPYTGSPEDIAVVESWQAKETPYYDTAVNIWTVRDVNKRKTAEKNGLRYYELFPVDGKSSTEPYKQLIDNLYEKYKQEQPGNC